MSSDVLNAAVPAAKAVITRARVVAWEARSQARRRAADVGLRVLLYHRIDFSDDALALSPTRFRAQMEHLADAGYQGVDVVTALDRLHAGTLSPNTIAITFDDGFKDLENAVGDLERLGFTATVFVATKVIDGLTNYSWQRQPAPVVSWDDIRALEARGTIKFEAHSLTHRNLTRLSEQECRREISSSKSALEQEIGRESQAFCYPFGFVGARERRLVGETGFRYGITCEPGLNSAVSDPLLVSRIQIDRADNMKVFAAKIRGSHDRPLPGRRIYRRMHFGIKTPPMQPSPAPEPRAPSLGPRNALIVSSFVLPHVGGIEQYVAWAADDLRAAGWKVRVMAAAAADGSSVEADVTVPTIFVLDSDHPVPYRGWLRIWREVGKADLVIANQHRNLLPVLTALLAVARGRVVIFVIHAGGGIPAYARSWRTVLGQLFDETLAQSALRQSVVVSLSGSGREMVRDHWQLDSRYVPFPIRLQTLVPPKTLAAGEPARAVWVGRLHPQKDPELAVRAVEAARRHYEIVLEMYGDGMLRAELDELARDRPWLVLHGERTWEEVQELQAGGHFCLLSSRNEATCLAALEPLSRGVPVVATGVGDIGQHLGEELARFATPPDDPEALGAAMVELCQNYKVYAAAFVANAERLRHHHREGPETLSALVDELVPPAVGKEPRVVDISAAGDAARPVSRKGAAKPPVVRGS